MELKKFTKSLLIYVLIFSVVLGIAMMYRVLSKADTRRIAFSTMTSYLQDGKIKEINITGTKITGKLSKNEYVYTYASNIVDIQYLNDNFHIQLYIHYYSYTFQVDILFHLYNQYILNYQY